MMTRSEIWTQVFLNLSGLIVAKNSHAYFSWEILGVMYGKVVFGAVVEYDVHF